MSCGTRLCYSELGCPYNSTICNGDQQKLNCKKENGCTVIRMGKLGLMEENEKNGEWPRC